MQAMVLAAGLGTRMRPLTLAKAKPALPVLGRPVIQWTLELLARHGVTDVVVNLHHRPATVRAAIGALPALGLNVTYSYERTILGTGGGPRKARRFFGDGPLLLVNGDVLFDFDLSLLVRRHTESGVRATLALLPNPDPRHYGSVVTDGRGRVRSLSGRPRPARGTVSLFTGVHVLDPALLDRLPPGPSDTVRDLYAPMVAEGDPPLGVRVKGPWYDLGSPSLYLASHMSLLASRFRGIRRRSLVDPTAHVDPQARIVRSVVGAASVVAAHAEVRDSVLWDRVRVGEGAMVDGCILGTGVRLDSGEAVARTLLMRRHTPMDLSR